MMTFVAAQLGARDARNTEARSMVLVGGKWEGRDAR